MLKTIIQTMRPPFLILTLSCVWLGIAVARYGNPELTFDSSTVLLILYGALNAHISVNMFNEYLDFSSGLDLETERTPFSGGSGGLPENPAAKSWVLGIAVLTLLQTIATGVYFIMHVGIGLLWIGLPGIALILAYTTWINRMAWLCLISPGLAFGPLMVLGTEYVLTGSVSMSGALASSVPFFMTNNLLLMNQLPDIAADKKAGRRHFAIRYSFNTSLLVYFLMGLAAILIVITAVIVEQLPQESLLTLLFILPWYFIFQGIRSYAPRIQAMLPFMGMNVAVAILSPAVLGVSLWF